MIFVALALLAADPTSLNTALAAAQPGDTVQLVPGSYGTVTIKSRTFNPPLTISAGTASFDGVVITNAAGITWTGGTMTGDPTNTAGNNYGVRVTTSQQIIVDSTHISTYRAGIVFDRVTGGAVTNNWLTNMSSDGADFASSRNITVAHNACTGFNPAPEAHPDCIQLWSVAGLTPTADITITANSIVGSTQGISLFNHIDDGVDQGGFDRINISGNTVLNTYGDGISVYECRGCTVHNNSVGSLPNYINKAQLYVDGGTVDQCGNTVTLVPRQSTPPCAS